MTESTIIVRTLGLQDYATCWHSMQQFTQQRDENALDEIWLLEHPAVFTQGQNGKPEHILQPGNIPIIKVDRGGQVTYHGPGQLVCYTLVNLQRKKLNVREFVTRLETAVIEFLKEHRLYSSAKPEAPGVYINDKKICSIGLRIRRGCAFHGLAFNVAMDLTPFSYINPCGFANLEMTQLSEYLDNVTIEKTMLDLTTHLMKNLGYTKACIK